MKWQSVQRHGIVKYSDGLCRVFGRGHFLAKLSALAGRLAIADVKRVDFPVGKNFILPSS